MQGTYHCQNAYILNHVEAVYIVTLLVGKDKHYRLCKDTKDTFGMAVLLTEPMAQGVVPEIQGAGACKM